MKAWIEKAVDLVPHSVWVTLWTLIGAFGTGALQYLQQQTPLNLIAFLQTKQGIASLIAGAVGGGLTTVLSTIKLPKNAAARLARMMPRNSTGWGGPPGSDPTLNHRRSILPPLRPWVPFAGLNLLVLAVLFLTSCLTSAPKVPVTQGNKAWVDACQTDARVYDGVVIGDFVVTGGTAGVSGAAAFVTDTNAKNALAITGAGLAGVAIIGSGIAALSASNFANSKCSDVVGDLPKAATVDGGAP